MTDSCKCLERAEVLFFLERFYKEILRILHSILVRAGGQRRIGQHVSISYPRDDVGAAVACRGYAALEAKPRSFGPLAIF